MRRFSDVERFFIDNCDLPIETMARKLKTKVGVVQHYIDWREKQKALKEEDETEEVVEEKPKRGTIDELMIKIPKRGVVVMTKVASEKGDATRKEGRNERTEKNIHKIRE